MAREITIEVEEDGSFNTQSNFDLGTTLVIIEKVRQELVSRAQVKRADTGDEQEEEDED